MLCTKGALVTGAAQRIGRSIALRLASDGWHVIVHHRDSNDAAASAVQEIADAGGVATALHADLSDSAACVALIEDASAATKGLTCLINNASMFVEDRIDNVSASLFDQVMAVNLRAPALLSRHFAAQLPEEARDTTLDHLAAVPPARLAALRAAGAAAAATFRYDLAPSPPGAPPDAFELLLRGLLVA